EITLHAVVLVKQGEVPRTTSGKVKRSACREAWLAGNLATVFASVVSPEDLDQACLPENVLLSAPEQLPAIIERQVVAFVSRLTQTPQDSISREASLIELGVDSRGAVLLQHCLERDFGVALDIEELLGRRSVAEIVDMVREEISRGARSVNRVDDNNNDDIAEYNLSPGQRSLWYVYQLS